MEKIESFSGNYRWLSNFWPCLIVMGEYTYPSTENAYQAAKFPRNERLKFTTCSPGMAKKMGQDAKLPDNWDKLKLETMLKINRKKFARNTYIALQLLSTGNTEIIEGNTWGDTFWGVCDGEGQNRLGKILMQIRSELQAQPSSPH